MIIYRNYIDREESVTYEITVRKYNHPKEGVLYGTYRDWDLLSVIGPNGPVDFQVYPEEDYFSVGDFVTHTEEDAFTRRG